MLTLKSGLRDSFRIIETLPETRLHTFLSRSASCGPLCVFNALSTCMLYDIRLPADVQHDVCVVNEVKGRGLHTLPDTKMLNTLPVLEDNLSPSTYFSVQSEAMEACSCQY